MELCLSPPNPLTFAPRRVLDCGTVAADWTAKVYAILSDRWSRGDVPPAPVRDRMVRRAMEALDSPTDHPVGFAIFHLAEDGIYLLVSRFNNANNLRHSVFGVSSDVQIAPLDDPQIIACIWELRLMMAEADAWIETVLRPGNGLTDDAQAAYLAARYAGETV